MQIHRTILFALISIFFSMIASAAIAESRAWHLQQVVGDHQDSTSTVIVRDNGQIEFQARFSNGHKTDGDHFVAEVLAVANDGTKVFSAIQGAGVNATFGGRTRVITVSKIVSVDPTKVALIAKFFARHYQKDTKGEIGFFIGYDGEEWSLEPVFDPVHPSIPPSFIEMASVPVPQPPKPAPYSIHRDCINATGKICP